MSGGAEKKPPPSAAAKGQAQPSSSFNDLAKRAAASREADKTDEAIELYRRCLRLKPRWQEGWWYVGTLLYDQDRYVEARDALRRFVVLDAHGGPGWVLLGLCEYEVREYERALTHLQRGLKLGLGGNEELSSVARFHTALLLTRSERFEEAVDMLFELVRAGNKNPSVIEAIGLAVLHMPFLPIEAPPDKRELTLLAGRAVSYLAGDPRPEARKYFEELISRYPDVPNVHYAFGMFLLPEFPDEALREFRREIAVSPSHLAARYQIIDEYLRRAQPKNALPFAEEVAKLAPESFLAHRSMGRCLLGAGDVPRAIQELETAVRMDPDVPESHFMLASAYTRAGQKDNAAREQAEFARLKKLAKNK